MKASCVVNRRQALLAVAACGLAAPMAWAQAFPVKPVVIVVPYPAGGPVDVIARGLAQRLGEVWPQRVVIENKPGGTEILASSYVARAPADGHTLLLSANASLAWNQYLRKDLPYDPVKDFAPITTVSEADMVLAARGDLPAASVKEFVALMKASPGKYSYGSTGSGTGPHLWMEELKQDLGVDILHVPFQGVAPAVQALLGGQIDVAIVGSTAATPHLASKRLKVLAVSGDKRIAALPDVPTFSEAGYSKVDLGFYLGLSAPAATPQRVVRKIAADVSKVLEDKPFTDKLMTSFGFRPVGDSPDDFDKRLVRERKAMETRVRLTGIRLD